MGFILNDSCGWPTGHLAGQISACFIWCSLSFIVCLKKEDKMKLFIAQKTDKKCSKCCSLQLAKQAGLPAGVLNVVTASRTSAPSVGKELCENPIVKKISFTGSTSTGKVCSGGFFSVCVYVYVPVYALAYLFAFVFMFVYHIEGSQPEWCISSMVYSRDGHHSGRKPLICFVCVCACTVGIFLGLVIPLTSKLALQWLPCRVPGIIGSVLRLVGLVSVYCDWVVCEESSICNFCLSVAARKLVWAGPSLRYTRMLLGH